MTELAAGGDAASAALPEWPPNQVKVVQADVEARTVRLNLRSKNVQLPAVRGWRITLDNSGNVGRVVSFVDTAGTTVVIGSGWSQIDLSAPDAVVEVPAPSGRRFALTLSGPVREVHLPRGAVTVNGSVSYTAHVPSDDGTTTIKGNASLQSVVGTGTVVIECSIDPGAVGERRAFMNGFAGTAKTAGALQRLAITSSVRVEAGEVDDCDLEIPSLAVSGAVRSSTVTATERFRAREVHDSRITVTAALPGPGVVVGSLPEDRGPLNRDLLLAIPEAASHLPATDPLAESEEDEAPPAPVVFSGGPVVNSTLRCEGGDVYLGDTECSTVESTASILCRGTLGVEAKDGARALFANGLLVVLGKLVLRDGDDAEVQGLALVTDRVEHGTLQAPLVHLGGLVGTSVIAHERCVVSGQALGGSVDSDQVEISGGATSTVIPKARTVWLDGDLETVSVSCTDDITIASEATADGATTATVAGNGTFPAGYRGTITWSPTLATNTLRIGGTPNLVDVTAPPGAPGEMVVDPGEAWQRLRVTGGLQVTTVGDHEWRVESTELTTKDSVLTVRPSATCNLGDLSAGLGSTLRTVPLDLPEWYGVAASLRRVEVLVLLCGSPITVSIPSDDPNVELLIEGPATVTIDGAVKRVTSRASDSGTWPKLCVPEQSVVNDLRGHLRLGAVDGRIDVRPSSERQVTKRLWGRLCKQRVPGSAPVIHDIDPPDGKNGHVVGIDPTEVPFASLEHASNLHVFGPDPDALMDWAADKRSEEHERRTAAAKAQRIAEQVKASSASGGARSSAQWAAARAHQAAIPKRSWAEHALRTAHRCLGYSQRPGPAFLSFVTAVVAWTTVAQLANLTEYKVDGTEVGHFDGPDGTIVLALRIASLPFSWLLRLPEDEGAASLFRDHWVGVVAFLTTGLPFVFFVIALRNFMAAPSSREH